MIVNYYGILGCECIWDQNGVFLSAPAGVQVQSLQQLGFYTAADGRWFKQLTSQESAYLESRRNMAVVDLPEYGYSGLPYSSEESPEDKHLVLDILDIWSRVKRIKFCAFKDI